MNSILRNIIKSKISGSIAQFLRVVFPFAFTAANKAFSVAPTEIIGNLIVVPFKLSYSCLNSLIYVYNVFLSSTIVL